ncbi:MAG: thymidylate synthase, partial [Burkholderiales bacterium]
IWTDWPLDRYRRATGEAISREEFSSRIVADAGFAGQWGDLGPVYGKQWVDWPVYETAGEGLFKRAKSVNQVAELVDSLKHDPGSRRHIVEGWNVAELPQMALPPCHKTYQFHVADGKLSGLIYQRSCDVALGLPFNLWSGALFIRILAQQCGLEPGELVWMGGDVHLYLNHAALIEEQLRRVPSGQARMAIALRAEGIFDYRIEDFAVADYAPQGHIAAPIAV